MDRATIPEVRKSAEDLFAAGFYCAESVVMAIAKAEGVDFGTLAENRDRVRRRDGPDVRRLRRPYRRNHGRRLGAWSLRADGISRAHFAATRRLIHDFEREFGARDCQALLGGCDLGTPEGQAMFNEQKLRRRCLRFTGGAAEIAARVIVESKG